MQKGFLKSLFDLSFTSLIATRLIKVLYVLAMLGIGVYAAIFILAAFNASTGAGLFVLIVGAPLFALVALIYTRVLLEVFVALFRIMENTNELVSALRPPAGGSTPIAPGSGTPAVPPPPPA